MAVSKRRRTRTTITKAAGRPAITPAATFTLEQVTALMGAFTRNVGPINPLPRQPELPFGPGVPIIPAPLNPPRDDGSGRPEPRIYEYPVSINLPGFSDRLVPWKVLRDAAEIPVVRDCLRIRKNAVASLEWDIVVSKRALQTYRRQDPDTSSVSIQRELRNKLDPEVGRLVGFWQKPDFQQDESFVEWCGKALEEHHVLDALVIYPFADRAGKRQGLRIIDGSTVKPLLDAGTGGRPMPPYPAYQQLLWGFPRGEFIADTDSDGNVVNGFPGDRLIYKRREVRAFSPYGFSGVEQALMDIDLYLRRLEWNKAQYTDGVQPAGWIKNTGLESWTPQQLADYTRAFNDLYAGQTMQRMRYHLLPPGLEPMETSDVAERYKPDYDLHLIKLVAMHLDTTIAELGFTESKGLGSSGYHEGQENVQERKATHPDLKWLQAILTEISHTHLGMPPELEFRFLGLDSEEEAAADEVIENQLKSGRITWNEAREEAGRAPFSFAEADMPVVQTSRGIIFVENASLLTEPGEEVTPVQAPPLKAPPEGADANGTGPDEPDQDQPERPAAPVVRQRRAQEAGKQKPPPVVGAADAKKAELAAYWKWCKNGHNTRRPFEFTHLTKTDAMLHEIDTSSVLFKAGDAADPKGRREHPPWPGWEMDLHVAHHWATQLRTALTASPTRIVASRWLDVRKAATITDPDTDHRRQDALIWLTSIGYTLTSRIQWVLAGLYTDAYYVGDRSAQVVLGQIEHLGWGDWQPGDPTTSHLINRTATTPELARLLDQASEVAAGINTTKTRAIANILGNAIGTSTDVDSLDAELRSVLDDADAADVIGWNETSRGITAAAIDRYTITPGITQYEWVTGGGNVCPRCIENSLAGPLTIGQSFPNGTTPPLHPRCSCSLLPVLPSFYSGLTGP